MSVLIPQRRIQQTIFFIRGHNVMLDSDLAHLYGVTAGRLNEAVKRNEDRFPSDFMFQLTKPEFEHLKSQIAISSSKWGGRRHAPYAFTEQGVAMLSSVLYASVREPRLCMTLRGEIVKKRCETGAWSRERRRRTPAVR